MGWLVWLLLWSPAPCGSSPIPDIDGITGDALDAEVMASAMGMEGSLRRDARALFEAAPVGTRCVLGSVTHRLGEAASVRGRLTSACGLECAPPGARMPLMAYIDSNVLLGAPYDDEAWPEQRCGVDVAALKLASGRWVIDRTTNASPERPDPHRSREPLDGPRRIARAWSKGGCPYERLAHAVHRAEHDAGAEPNGDLMWEYLNALRCRPTKAEELAERFELFARASYHGEPIRWAPDLGYQLRAPMNALDAAEALAALRPLTDEERSWLPELWARVPLGLRATSLCAAMRDPERSPEQLSAPLALATLAHCPDALSAQPHTKTMERQALEAVVAHLGPICLAPLIAALK